MYRQKFEVRMSPEEFMEMLGPDRTRGADELRFVTLTTQGPGGEVIIGLSLAFGVKGARIG